MIENKFRTTSNPFGTIYQPLAICKTLKGELNENDLMENRGIFYHWDTHGEVSALTEEELKSIVTEKQHSLQQHLKTSNWLIITFGSTYAYRLKSSDQLVANCQKYRLLNLTKSYYQ